MTLNELLTALRDLQQRVNESDPQNAREAKILNRTWNATDELIDFLPLAAVIVSRSFEEALV